MSKRHYEWNDLDQFVLKAAGLISKRYRNYVTFEDVTNEIYVWLYDHRSKVRKWLSSSPQQTTRIFRSFYDTARGYAEKEKATRVGYEVEDVAWYSYQLVEGLLPLALDSDFYPESVNEREREAPSSNRRPPSEGGELMTMVIDIRRALNGTGLTVYFLENDSSSDVWESRVEQLVDFLGGMRPYIGRRKVLSNAAAQAVTRQQEVA